MIFKYDLSEYDLSEYDLSEHDWSEYDLSEYDFSNMICRNIDIGQEKLYIHSNWDALRASSPRVKY